MRIVIWTKDGGLGFTGIEAAAATIGGALIMTSVGYLFGKHVKKKKEIENFQKDDSKPSRTEEVYSNA